MSLQELGWDDFFANQLSHGIPGRVVSAVREHFLVWTEASEVEARAAGHLRQAEEEEDWPCVGDWVVLRDNAPVIERVMERKTKLSRRQPGKQVREQVLAANLDVLFIVSGLDRDYNPRRIERYLVLAQESGARPVILLNKMDLAAELNIDVENIIAEIREITLDDAVLPISALSGQSLEAITAFVSSGETAVLIGSSGVGKSTILNGLLGQEVQQTQAVRADDNGGRHTTTRRELFRMPGGWLLMDLPGLREVQLWTDVEQLDHSFEDIHSLAQSCRFRDCSHRDEPGCAVQNSGIDPGRLANYQKLQRELAYLERKTDLRAAREQRQKWKAIEKSVRAANKRRKKS